MKIILMIIAVAVGMVQTVVRAAEEPAWSLGPDRAPPARDTLTRVTNPFKAAPETRHPVCRLRFKRHQSLM
jgi:hypothetical protein